MKPNRPSPASTPSAAALAARVFSRLAALLGLSLAIFCGAPAARALETILANYQDNSLLLLDLTTGDRSVLSSATVGTGPGFARPVSMALAPNGDLYSGQDSGSNAIIKVDVATGNRSALINPDSLVYGQIYGLAFDSAGKLIATSAGASSIYSIDVATGARTTLASPSVGSGVAVGSPGGFLIEANGDIVYTDFGASWRLIRLNPTTLVRTEISSATVGEGPLAYRAGTVVKLPDGDYLVSNYWIGGGSDGWVTRVNATNGDRFIVTSGTRGTGPTLSGVFSQSISPDGILYVSSSFTNEVVRVDVATGDRTVVAGGAVGTGTALNFPLGILPQALPSIGGSAPVVTSEASRFTALGVYFSYTITATNSATSYSASPLPAGLTFSTTTGEIFGYPTTSGTYTIDLGATNSSGTGTATLTLTVGQVAQTITFPALANKLATDAAITLGATSSAGLPITYTVVSGPAQLDGNTLKLTGAPGTVTVRASQVGNLTYSAAPDVTRQFTVAAVGPQVFFGSFNVAVPVATPHALVTHDASTKIAANLTPDGTAGTLIGYLDSTAQAFVLNFTPANDGSFSGTAQVYSVATTAASSGTEAKVLSVTAREGALATTGFTITGNVANGTITGTIVEKSLTFSASVQSQTGPAAALAGYYVAPATNTASGSSYVILNANGDAFVLAITPTLVNASSATVTASGAITASLAAGNFTGTINPNSTIITASLTSAASGTVTFGGIKASTLRTDRLVNLSSRAQSGPGDKVLITGFVIGGSTSKRVLLRGVGPTLGSYGVQSPLPNPKLKVFNSTGALVLENDDWSDPGLATAATATGAFALPAGSKDAAIIATLSPGAYTMHISDASGATGVALAEIYDASQNPQADYQRLVNISSRGQVGAGENALFGGFVVTGNSPKRVLIRGVGPGLVALGVTGALSDPMVEVYQGSTVIAKNDNWSTPVAVGATQNTADAATISQAATITGAFALTAASKDAALVVTLAPGAYTALVSGIGGASGVALIEVYEIP